MRIGGSGDSMQSITTAATSSLVWYAEVPRLCIPAMYLWMTGRYRVLHIHRHDVHTEARGLDGVVQRLSFGKVAHRRVHAMPLRSGGDRDTHAEPGRGTGHENDC
jgi:hypothetical protein